MDFQTRAGREYITSSYIYEPDKFRAMGILNTVSGTSIVHFSIIIKSTIVCVMECDFL